MVSKIDVVHLQHYKTLKDLPNAYLYQGIIYQTRSRPGKFLTIWEKGNYPKLQRINDGDDKKISKKKIDWPWFAEDGTPVVRCPFTKKKIRLISKEYIMNLPEKYSRYAKPMSWFEFDQNFPNTMLEADVYSLERESDPIDGAEFGTKIYQDYRITQNQPEKTIGELKLDQASDIYENVFKIIDEQVSSATDRKIMKLIAMGYSVEDITDALEIAGKEIGKRMRSMKQLTDLEESLLNN